MARNKKPRKPHREKPITIRMGITKKDLDGMNEIIDKASLIATIKLPTGKTTDDDVHWIQDCLMWTRWSLHDRFKKRHEHFDEVELTQFLEVLTAGTIAYAEVVGRFREYKTNAYTPRADELKAIVDAVAMCRDYLRERVSTCPCAALTEWDKMKKEEKRTIPNYRQKLK